MVYFGVVMHTLPLSTKAISKLSKDDTFFIESCVSYDLASEIFFILYETVCPRHSSSCQIDAVEWHPYTTPRYMPAAVSNPQSVFIYLMPKITGKCRLDAGE